MHDASSKQTLHFMRFASQAKHATTDTILFIKHDMHIAHKYSTDSAYAMIQTSSVSFWHFNRIIHEHIQTDYGSVDLISYLGRWLGLTHSQFILTLARAGVRDGWSAPGFFSEVGTEPPCSTDGAEILHSLWDIHCATLKMIGPGQGRRRSYDVIRRTAPTDFSPISYCQQLNLLPLAWIQTLYQTMTTSDLWYMHSDLSKAIRRQRPLLTYDVPTPN